MFRANKTLDNSKKSANKRGEDLIIRHFLSDLIREKGNVALAMIIIMILWMILLTVWQA